MNFFKIDISEIYSKALRLWNNKFRYMELDADKRFKNIPSVTGYNPRPKQNLSIQSWMLY